MDWFYGLKIRNKIMVPIAIIGLMMLAMGILVLYKFELIDNKVRQLGEVNLSATNYLLVADADVHKVLVEERSMLFLNPDSPEFSTSVTNHQKSLQSAHEKMAAFNKLMHEEEFKGAYNQYEIARDKWEQLTKTVVSARQSNTREGRTTAIEISFKDGNAAFEDMRVAIYTLKGNVQSKASEAMQQSHDAVKRSYFVIIVFIVISIAVALVMLYLIPRLILEPVYKMQKFIKSLAGDGGDLTHKIPIQYYDEIGNLGETINEFIENLRGLLARVIGMGEVFDKQASTLAALANKNSTLVQKETHEVALVASAITELSTSVQAMADTAIQAADRTQLAQQESKNGLGVVKNTIKAIDRLANEVQKSASVIVELNAESGSIASVVNVIKSIAEQINLLALNAAIEAARAGEQGRGFAVVADSVRELAFRTAESTQEIQAMIGRLQASATSAVNAMQASQSIAQESVTEASAAGDALQKIDDAVSQVTQLNSQIAAAVDQQSQVAGEISENTNNISLYAQDADGLAKNVEGASEELAQVASSLHEELYKFKI
ncbi:chemotaxis transducer [Cellvibrio zantedeschiae]|uniref:Chemotaxis transducer n=1 Tax=Cellvibrio zantedeschiae TaxID=1237077 RepID=A0ABQ3AY11_9GAMM|nr:methyl-accepting chemotaxis protein [Cellvibrio zantedeschiae]GGY70387.1 chemotaxis transducer [Cellvibrio zantedeschiae]